MSNAVPVSTGRLGEELLARPVQGLHLRPGPLGAQLEGGPTLLCFLRHFG